MSIWFSGESPMRFFSTMDFQVAPDDIGFNFELNCLLCISRRRTFTYDLTFLVFSGRYA